MRTSRWFAIGALVTSFAWLLAGGCSSSASPGNGGGNTSGSGGATSNQPDGSMVMPDAVGPEGGAGNNLHPLCGAGACLPDSPKACRDYEPPSSGGAGQGGASSGGEGGQSAGNGQGGVNEAGTGGEGASGAPTGGAGEGSGGAAAGAAGAAGASNGGADGEGGQSDPGTPSLYSCQVVRMNNQPLRQCELAGSGKENAPCFSSAECAAGLACVSEGDAGRCLAYCCSADSECGPDTYCAERQLRKASGNANGAEPASVPVCVPADGCSLDDQYPCPEGKTCRCEGNTACMVVRDGTTTCVEPGAGQQGEACPCAWNHLCSKVINACVKICHTDPAKMDCGTQKCQASAELPPNFGVCVGPVN
jgi:hypothetical protein